ncbi:cytidylate kinase family protein [Selenomonas felix]|uniref:cytidylate kinase family protein n=1 Tax=Selenomonas felix TaxID=1944634 RepID=UPI0023555613|nr:cytidylate kinase family protein [Selenomonas felix]
MDQKTLITITRQYGSGGREVAEILAKKMGVKRYDRKIVAMAAENVTDAEDAQDFESLIERSYPEIMRDLVAREARGEM